MVGYIALTGSVAIVAFRETLVCKYKQLDLAVSCICAAFVFSRVLNLAEEN